MPIMKILEGRVGWHYSGGSYRGNSKSYGFYFIMEEYFYCAMNA